MKNKKIKKQLIKGSNKGTVSLNNKGQKLYVFFFSQLQLNLINNTKEFCEESMKKVKNRLKVKTKNGEKLFTEQSSELGKSSRYKDAKVMAITTKDDIVLF